TITTTIRPIQSGKNTFGSRAILAALLPVGGFAFVGLGLGRKKMRLLMGVLFCAMLGATLFQAGCGSESSTVTPTGGTPAGTYPITVTATSGSATRTTSVTLVVQ